MKSVALNTDAFDDVWELFCESFQKDAYYQNLVESAGVSSLYAMKDMFSPAIKYCLQETELSFGVYNDDKLIAFVLSLDFQKLCNNKNMYDYIFGLDSSDANDAEKEILQKKLSVVKQGNEKTVYCLTIVVKETHRRKGIASSLIDRIIEQYPDYDIVTDVSNKSSLGIYKPRGFKIESINDDYFFVHKISTQT